MKLKQLIGASILLFVSPIASAANTVVWDESVDGDASGNLGFPTVLNLVPGENLILGTQSLENFSIEQDRYRLVVPVGFVIASIDGTVLNSLDNVGVWLAKWVLRDGPQTNWSVEFGEWLLGTDLSVSETLTPSYPLTESSYDHFTFGGTISGGLTAFRAIDYRWIVVVVNPTDTTTPVGTDVEVQPTATDEFGNPIDDAPVTFSFDEVTGEGDTTVTITNSGEPLPLTFKFGNPPTYYNLETTATITGNIEVCIDYTGTTFTSETNAKLLHFAGMGWDDITTTVDTEANVICGVTTLLSPFVIAEAASPEEMITGLMFKVMQLNLKKGITNSFDAKLESATGALIDSKEQNDGAAVNLLYAFMNAVDAQRGKELTDTEADDLIMSAEDIIQALGF